MKTQLTSSQLEVQKSLMLDIDPDCVWVIEVDQAEIIYNCRIEWNRYKLSNLIKINIQMLLLNIWKPFYKNGNCVIKPSHYRLHTNFMRIGILVEELFPGKCLYELEKNELIKIVQISVFREWSDLNEWEKKLNPIGVPLSYQVLDRQISALRLWYSLYQSGAVSDGPDFELNFKDIKNSLIQEFDNLNINYAKWKQGGTFGAIDFTVSHLLLSDAIDILHSRKTEEILAYFEIMRSQSSAAAIKLFWKADSGAIEKYRSTGSFEPIGKEENRSELYRQVVIEIIEPLDEKLKTIDSQRSLNFPWRTYRSFVNEYNRLIIAIYIIFLNIMGKRGPSEVLTLRAIDITPPDADVGRDATMSPAIKKTNHGIREKQGVSNFVENAFIVLLKLGYKDKTDTELPLFSALYLSLDKALIDPRKLSVSHSYVLMGDYYDQFCIRMQEKIDFVIKDMQPNIASHMFRHSFADFGLRCFDGDVEEHLRQHFCHQTNHWWTKSYTADKLDSDYSDFLSRRYIQELISRIVFDDSIDPDFVGAMSIYIKKKFGDTTLTYSAEEIESRLAETSDDILQLTPHEYGFCLVHKMYRSSAQCADDNGNPKPSHTDSSKCNRCANFCASRKSHLNIQRQIAMSHIDFLEQGIWKSERLTSASVAAVRNAQSIFPELIELGEV